MVRAERLDPARLEQLIDGLGGGARHRTSAEVRARFGVVVGCAVELRAVGNGRRHVLGQRRPARRAVVDAHGVHALAVGGRDAPRLVGVAVDLSGDELARGRVEPHDVVLLLTHDGAGLEVAEHGVASLVLAARERGDVGDFHLVVAVHVLVFEPERAHEAHVLLARRAAPGEQGVQAFVVDAFGDVGGVLFAGDLEGAAHERAVRHREGDVGVVGERQVEVAHYESEQVEGRHVDAAFRLASRLVVVIVEAAAPPLHPAGRPARADALLDDCARMVGGHALVELGLEGRCAHGQLGVDAPDDEGDELPGRQFVVEKLLVILFVLDYDRRDGERRVRQVGKTVHAWIDVDLEVEVDVVAIFRIHAVDGEIDDLLIAERVVFGVPGAQAHAGSSMGPSASGGVDGHDARHDRMALGLHVRARIRGNGAQARVAVDVAVDELLFGGNEAEMRIVGAHGREILKRAGFRQVACAGEAGFELAGGAQARVRACEPCRAGGAGSDDHGAFAVGDAHPRARVGGGRDGVDGDLAIRSGEHLVLGGLKRGRILHGRLEFRNRTKRGLREHLRVGEVDVP